MNCGILCIIIGVFVTIVVVINIISGVRKNNVPVLLVCCFGIGLGSFMIMTGNEMASLEAENAAKDEIEKEALELAGNDGVQIFINGEPVSENFDINGIDFDDYEINISENKVYLMNP